MSGRAFVDTNVLTYLFDDSEADKQSQARARLRKEIGVREIVVSTQVLQELYVSLTKGRNPIATTEVAEQAVRHAAMYTVIQVDVPLVLSSIDTSRRSTLSFWDGLIVAAAARSGCEILLSEDLNDGQVIDGVRVENPFR